MSSGRLPPVELTEQGLAALGTHNGCDREPIHLSGAIQPHGFLLGIDPVSTVITAASANVPHLIDGAAQPLGLALENVLGPEVARVVRSMKPTSNPHDGLPVAFALTRPGIQDTMSVDMVTHQRGPVLLLEFEETSDTEHDVAGFNHLLRDAMKGLLNVDDSDEICRVTAQDIRRLTGYDRVMIYRFEPDGHGHVIAEDRRDACEPFLGLHYPASDIPRQARAMYLRNLIRLIVDVEYDPVAINGLAGSVSIDQLDLSMSVLRSVSPVHLQYLRNMGVAATMTISLVIDNQLWGMIACHHDSPKLIGPVHRLAFETLGQLVAVRLGAIESMRNESRIRAMGRMAAQVVTGMAAGENPAAGAAIAAEPLLGMADADGVVVEIDGVRISAGTVPGDPVVDRVVSALSELTEADLSPVVTDALNDVVALPRGSELSASGAMLVPLMGRAHGFVVWLRGERSQTVRWAGRPEAKVDGDDKNQIVALTPRASFAEWIETVRGHSTPWGAGEIAAATELAKAMPEVLLHRAQNRLVRLALHDSLTGLPNRAFLVDQMSALLRPREPESEEFVGDDAAGVAVLFVDLDGFKAVNDTQGHLIGDELLSLAARRIAAAVRPQDTVARLGGDEFVVLVPGVNSDAAVGIGQRIVEVFRLSFLTADSVRNTLTLSVGISVVALGIDPGEALRQADMAMYHAKRSGRDHVALYDRRSGNASSCQPLPGDELSDAIDAGQITVHYQPIMDITGNDMAPALAGFEALARWEHPTRGLVAPATFIAQAEDTNLIDTLGDAVMREALLQLRAWDDPRLTMAVNVSVMQLIRPGFASHVVEQLAELAISPRRLCLEITESQMMEQPELALGVLSELRAVGVNIAIDDFGTGFSSLAYVRNLPATMLKIDRMFVSELPPSAKDDAVITATVALAHSLGMRTVAEGVETTEQLDRLRGLGSDFAQGYLLGRPAAAHAIRPDDVSSSSPRT